MVTVTTTVTLPLILSQKCVKYGLNKSKIAREAVIRFIEDYEKEHGIVDDGELHG